VSAPADFTALQQHGELLLVCGLPGLPEYGQGREKMQIVIKVSCLSVLSVCLSVCLSCLSRLSRLSVCCLSCLSVCCLSAIIVILQHYNYHSPTL
jgi:hypothetical protein